MEISIKNDRKIEELADEIISLSEITTNTTEVKTKIINLITDKLYNNIKNVSLSTIIKEQLETPQVTKKNDQKVETKPVEEQSTKPAKPTESAKSSDLETITPEQVFGPKPSTPDSTQPTEQPTTPAQPTSQTAQTTAQPAASQPATPFTAETDTTITDDDMPTNNVPDPLTQYQQNGKAQSGNLVYNGTTYNYLVKTAKRGPLAGKQAIIVEYHVPKAINEQIIQHPEIKQDIENTVKQLNAKYAGQTPSFYNAKYSLAFVMALENTLNDYVNDLDMIMHVIQNKTEALNA